MPKRYEEIRDRILADVREKTGKRPSVGQIAEAKRVAAATFNKTRKKGEAPVTGKHR